MEKQKSSQDPIAPNVNKTLLFERKGWLLLLQTPCGRPFTRALFGGHQNFQKASSSCSPWQMCYIVFFPFESNRGGLRTSERQNRMGIGLMSLAQPTPLEPTKDQRGLKMGNKMKLLPSSKNVQHLFPT